MSSVDDLAAFLSARYDEAEARAKAAAADTCADWHHVPAVTATGPIILIAGGVSDEIEVADAWAGQEAASHIADMDPAHRLRDITLKRAIVKRCRQAISDQGFAMEDGQEALAECVLVQLGTEFSDHPEYKQKWASWW